MKGKPIKKTERSKPLSRKQKAEITTLAALPNNRINTAALPQQRIGAARGAAFFSTDKKQLTLRLDADVIDWFKTQVPEGEAYQTRINRALREYIAQRDGGR